MKRGARTLSKRSVSWATPKQAREIRESVAKSTGIKVDPKAIVAYEYYRRGGKKMYALLFTNDRLEFFDTAEARDKYVGLGHNRYPRKTQYI